MKGACHGFYCCQRRICDAARHRRGPVRPQGHPGPTNATVAINVAFDDLWYAGEDGITESIARDSDKKKAFGGATVRILQTNYDNTFKFVLMEHKSAKVLKRVSVRPT